MNLRIGAAGDNRTVVHIPLLWWQLRLQLTYELPHGCIRVQPHDVFAAAQGVKFNFELSITEVLWVRANIGRCLGGAGRG